MSSCSRSITLVPAGRATWPGASPHSTGPPPGWPARRVAGQPRHGRAHGARVAAAAGDAVGPPRLHDLQRRVCRVRRRAPSVSARQAGRTRLARSRRFQPQRDGHLPRRRHAVLSRQSPAQRPPRRRLDGSALQPDPRRRRCTGRRARRRRRDHRTRARHAPPRSRGSGAAGVQCPAARPDRDARAARDRRDRGACGDRGTVASCTEDGSDRQPDRRHRARLQQRAAGDQRQPADPLRRSAPMRARNPGSRTRTTPCGAVRNWRRTCSPRAPPAARADDAESAATDRGHERDAAPRARRNGPDRPRTVVRCRQRARRPAPARKRTPEPCAQCA